MLPPIRIDPTQITVSFYGGLNYVYTYSSAGKQRPKKWSNWLFRVRDSTVSLKRMLTIVMHVSFDDVIRGEFDSPLFFAISIPSID